MNGNSIDFNSNYTYGTTRKVTVTEEEYDDKGNLVRKTITTTEYQPVSYPTYPSVPYITY